MTGTDNQDDEKKRIESIISKLNPETILQDAMDSILFLVNAGREAKLIPRAAFLGKLNRLVNTDLIGVFIDNPKLLEKFLDFLITNQILRVRREEAVKHSENCISISLRPDGLGVNDIFVLYNAGNNAIFVRAADKEKPSRMDTATLDVREFYSVEQMSQHFITILESGGLLNFSLNEAFNEVEA